MIRFSFDKTDILVQRSFKTKSDVLIAELVNAMNEMSERYRKRVIEEKLSGDPIQSRSGELEASIQPQPAVVQGSIVEAMVKYGGAKAPWAALLEFGGLKPYVIRPLGKEGTRKHEKGAKRRYGADVLRWFQGDKAIFAKYVFREPLVEHSFMRSTLREMEGEWVAEMKAASRRALRSK